jgi:hypothetical protein
LPGGVGICSGDQAGIGRSTTPAARRIPSPAPPQAPRSGQVTRRLTWSRELAVGDPMRHACNSHTGSFGHHHRKSGAGTRTGPPFTSPDGTRDGAAGPPWPRRERRQSAPVSTPPPQIASPYAVRRSPLVGPDRGATVSRRYASRRDACGHP